MPSSLNATARRVRIERAPVGLVAWREWVHRTLENVARASGYSLTIDGAKRAQNDENGATFEITGGTGGSSGIRPLQVKDDGTVSYGTILGVHPTIGGTPIAAGPALTWPESGTRYVIATVTGTPVQTTLASRTFTHSLSAPAVALSLTATNPTAADLVGTSSFVFPLAVWVDGVISQNGFGPIGGGLDDLLNGSGNAALNLTYPSS
jgi:hypothetical protein